MFDTLKEILHKVAKSRIFVLCVVMILLSSTLIGRLFYLQIIKGEEYQDNYSLKIQKPRILNGSRTLLVVMETCIYWQKEVVLNLHVLTNIALQKTKLLLKVLHAMTVRL